jgi:hypothetical protein
VNNSIEGHTLSNEIFGSVSGQVGDLDAREQVPESLHKFGTVDAGHDDVSEENTDRSRVFATDVNGVNRRVRDEDLISLGGEDSLPRARTTISSSTTSTVSEPC